MPLWMEKYEMLLRRKGETLENDGCRITSVQSFKNRNVVDEASSQVIVHVKGRNW